MKKILFILLLSNLFLCCRKPLNKQIVDQIKQDCNIRSNMDSCIIDINDFVDFKWDKMYVFPSWSMPEDISLIIGFKYNGEYVKDGTRKILFLDKTRIVYEESYDVTPGKEKFDFIDSCWPSICEFHNSKFIVKKMKPINIHDTSDYYRLYPIAP